MSNENFDTELERMREYLEKKFQAALDKAIGDAEKRALLRAPGQQYCRLCRRPTQPLNPAPSEIEKLWHEGNHGQGLPHDRSRGLSGQPAASDWDAFEKAVKARRR